MRLGQDELSRTFAALADPTRRAILARLATGAATVTELAEPFPISRPAVSQHLKVLREAGLVVQQANARYRTCRLQPEPLSAAQAWVVAQTAIWNTRFDALEARLEQLQAQEGSPDDDA